MRKNCFVFLFAAMVLLAGCAKEETSAPVGDAQSLTITLSQTKTHLGEREGSGPYSYKIYWSNGDKISVNGIESAALTGLAGTERTATFGFASSLGSAPYKILYPSSVYGDATHITLPAVQTYKSDGFADGMFPMAGYTSDGSSITIEHLCAVIKLSVKRATGISADTDNLVSVTFKGKNSEQVSGSFSIDYSLATLAGASSAEADKSVKVVKTLATATDAAAVYYIVVPAQTYSNGFDIIIQDASGDIMTQSKASSISLVAGKLYATPEIVFAPTGEADPTLTINSAEDLIAFATDYNNKVYEGQDDLIVALSSNITFDATTSSAFNATGGIGQKKGVGGATADNYFLGVFDGGGHTISGLTATVPLFAFTDSLSQIKGFTLSSTCSLTVGSPAVDSNHGALVGRNKGLIKNCTSNANVTINNIQDVSTAEQHYGGLVGRNYGGTVDGCSMTGNITCLQTENVTSSNNVYIGGIAGTQASAGSINNSSYTGNITFSDGSTYGGITITYLTKDKDDKDVTNGSYVYVGGILGYADNGIISECTSGIDGTPRSIDVRGTFVPSIGGIIGWSKEAARSEISDSDNYMSLSFASNGARTITTPTRIGGVAARAAASISGCTNSGAITSVSNSTTVYLGGIVADGANVSNCINEAEGTITRSNAEAGTGQTNRYMYIGGIMGGTTSACDVTECTNNAAILSNAIGTATQTTIDISGIVGCAGSSSAQQIDITSCNNNGDVTLVNNGTVVTTRLTIAGILGYGAAANTTIKSCSNNGQIYCNSQQNKAGRVSYSGGIAGLMGTMAAGVAGLEIGNCTNSKRVWNRNYNNTVTPASSTPFGGGIVAAIIGTDASKASIHDCTTTGGDVVELRGYCGGIAGYTQYATIADNTVGQALTGSNANSQGAGGLVGWAVSSSLSGCSTSANINAVKNVGGFVAKLDTGSSIVGCTLNGATLTKGTNDAATNAAVLVSNAAAGTTIANCGVKGTINNGSAETITLSSNMITTNGGASVSGTYILP